MKAIDYAKDFLREQVEENHEQDRLVQDMIEAEGAGYYDKNKWMQENWQGFADLYNKS